MATWGDMFSGMAKGLRKKTLPSKTAGNSKFQTRASLGPTLDTPAGRAEAEQAGNWFVKLRQDFFDQDALQIIKEPDARNSGSKLLPGYDDALTSARAAAIL